MSDKCKIQILYFAYWWKKKLCFLNKTQGLQDLCGASVICFNWTMKEMVHTVATKQCRKSSKVLSTSDWGTVTLPAKLHFSRQAYPAPANLLGICWVLSPKNFRACGILLKGTQQWSVYPWRTKSLHMHGRIWQPLYWSQNDGKLSEL